MNKMSVCVNIPYVIDHNVYIYTKKLWYFLNQLKQLVLCDLKYACTVLNMFFRVIVII